MREVGCVSLTPYAAMLKDKKNRLRSKIEGASVDRAGELLLELADTCAALGHWRRQKVCETLAKCEFGEASQARWNASQLNVR